MKIFLRFIIIVFVALYLFFYFSTLTRFPQPVSDEGWQISNALNFLETGDNSSPLLHPFSKPDLTRTILPDVFFAGAFKVLGPNLFAGRLLVSFFSLAILLLIFLIAKKLYGPKIGWLAVIIFALSPFIFEGRYIRNDTFLAFFILLALFCLIKYFQEKKTFLAFLSGLFVFLAYDIHQNAAFFIFAFLLLFFYQYRLKIFRQKGFYLFLGGGLLSLLVYFLIHIYPDPSHYFSTLRFLSRIEHPFPIFSETFADFFVKELKRYFFYFYPLAIFEAIFFGFALIAAFLRKKKEDLILLILILVPAACFFLFAINKNPVYFWPIFPLLAILTAKMIVDIFAETRTKKTKMTGVFVTGMVALLFLFDLGHLTRDFYRVKNCDYRRISEQVQTIVPKGAKIIALPRYMVYLANADYHFKNILIVSHYNLRQGKSFPESMAIEKPDYLLLDEELEGLIRPPLAGAKTIHGFSGFYFIPPVPFRDFLTEKGTLINDFTTGCYHLKIYQIKQS